jgi:hypothetical protein
MYRKPVEVPLPEVEDARKLTPSSMLPPGLIAFE